MATKDIKNVLTEEFLLELFNSAINNDYVCSMLTEHMDKSYLPDRDFQGLLQALSEYYKKHKSAPTFSIIKQATSSDRGIAALLVDIKDEASNIEPSVVLELFERYLKSVRFQKIYKEIGEMYVKHDNEKAEKELIDFAEWYNTFSLTSSNFIDVVNSTEGRFKRNREKHNAAADLKKRPICRFYIDDLDDMNGDRNLRGQLTCFLAPTGVGKSHAARWIGRSALMDDGLNVLHFQLEGSEDEVSDAYSAAIMNCNVYQYETGTLRDADFRKYMERLKSVAGTLKVKSYPKFSNQVSTVDIKNAIAEYKKLYNMSPDVIIIDSMDLLTDSSGRRWTEGGERHKRIAVANDLKDLASEEDVWIVVTYQATIENRDWLNDEKNVLTEYNCAEAKGLSRPMTHLITLNQSDNERTDNVMRLHVAKSRFFKKGKTVKIATNYDNEQFYDKTRSINLKLTM